ncbi:MAG: hypothetical protein HZC28_18200 [Spirochaetes bacterium]|nr:hypothetical protein [Spirochaetota bacterium]
MTETASDCKACGTSSWLTPDDITRMTREILAREGGVTVDAETYRERISRCGACGYYAYESTCRHCGCIIPVMAHFDDFTCMHPAGSKW